MKQLMGVSRGQELATSRCGSVVGRAIFDAGRLAPLRCIAESTAARSYAATAAIVAGCSRRSLSSNDSCCCSCIPQKSDKYRRRTAPFPASGNTATKPVGGAWAFLVTHFGFCVFVGWLIERTGTPSVYESMRCLQPFALAPLADSSRKPISDVLFFFHGSTKVSI